MHDPRAILTERRAARAAAVAGLERRDARIAMARLLAFGVMVALAFLSWGLHRVSGWSLVVPLAAFAVLVVLHDKALAALGRARRAVAFHDAGLSRLDECWAGTGDAGERHAQPDHPFALDLDLFGKGSLFELLSTARTRPGADALAGWLLAPAPAGEVRERQRAVAELEPKLDLREDLAVLGEDVRAEVHPERLARWAEGERRLPPGLALAAGLGALTAAAALVLWFAEVLPGWWFVGAVAALYALGRGVRDRLAEVLHGVERPGAELRVLGELLGRLERESLADPRLRALQAALGTGGDLASRRIGALGRVVELAGWAENQAFTPVAFLLGWRLQAGVAVERWRGAHGRKVRAWLAAVGELEALSSLAAHAFLHPADAFPEVEDGGATFDAEALAHPLLAAGKGVANDVRLGGDGARLLLVSGSNMSGKSTLLRTVGTNAVLALAGAPVRARRLRIAPLRLGATLRIQDSLAEGRSRFYAEITRLKVILDLAGAGAPPVLFLLDELLAGTNSRDRRIGAEALLRTLLRRGAIGLVTTHDLALAELAKTLEGTSNAHFTDEVHGDEVVFDYHLRPGVVEGSNALALMRAVGLEV